MKFIGYDLGFHLDKKRFIIVNDSSYICYQISVLQDAITFTNIVIQIENCKYTFIQYTCSFLKKIINLPYVGHVCGNICY